MKHTVLIWLVLAGTLSFARAADLEDRFRNPPEQTKPWCYWHWLNNDISKEADHPLARRTDS